MSRSKIFKIGMGLNLIPFLLGGIFYEKLPQSMAVHFKVGNSPNGFASKNIALFGIPAFIVALYVFTYFIMKEDPKSKNQGEKPTAFMLIFFSLFNIFVSVIMIFFNMGKNINVEFNMNLMVSILFIFLGNYMPKIKRNYSLGIKLPWTMNSDYVWEKTHRLAGYVWMTGGVLWLLANLFFLQYINYIMPTIFFLMISVPAVYSYYIYKNVKEKEE